MGACGAVNRAPAPPLLRSSVRFTPNPTSNTNSPRIHVWLVNWDIEKGALIWLLPCMSIQVITGAKSSVSYPLLACQFARGCVSSVFCQKSPVGPLQRREGKVGITSLDRRLIKEPANTWDPVFSWDPMDFSQLRFSSQAPWEPPT